MRPNVFRALVAVLSLAGCQPTEEKSTLSPIDAQLSARGNLRFLAKQVQTIEPGLRYQASSILELIMLMDLENPEATSGFLMGSTWRFSDQIGGIKTNFDYLVFSKPDGVAPEDALFIITPRAIQFSPTEVKRAALTHSLDYIELTEFEYVKRLEKEIRKKIQLKNRNQ